MMSAAPNGVACGRLATNGTKGSSSAHVTVAATNAGRSAVLSTPDGTLSRMSLPAARHLAGVALVSATLLMTELALTRIFSVVMYYHFAFLAISIALFGVSASGVLAYVLRRRVAAWPIDSLLAGQSLIYAVATIIALFFLVRLRVGLTYSRENLLL